MREPVARRFRDIREKDVVCEREGEVLEVVHILDDTDNNSLPRLILYNPNSTRFIIMGHPDQYIGLLYRPWPEGKTEQDMRTDLRGAAGFFHERNMGLEPLREALDAYELGKPFDQTEHQPSSSQI